MSKDYLLQKANEFKPGDLCLARFDRLEEGCISCIKEYCGKYVPMIIRITKVEGCNIYYNLADYTCYEGDPHKRDIGYLLSRGLNKILL